MATKNELRVGIKFETDNQQLEISKQKLSDIMMNLCLVKGQAEDIKVGNAMKTQFDAAAKEANKLQDILNKT